jgi:hypothetical protein
MPGQRCPQPSAGPART